VIGVSFGVASYLAHCQNLVAALAAIGADDIPVMAGGLIHRTDVDALHQAGIAGVFIPGHKFDEVVAWLEQTTGKPIGSPERPRAIR
jgi:methylmalonyl-CoA mutase cobalamin-binding domain/chain